ncbi:histidine kinase [Dysgonomonas alginatilytica]|uniref:Histidine kinase n=1 Tax=Dysgonomonas alginatilytica TaxID=1605892 RepID=A0A2V3PNH0_9BACT|nr:sensor histidine kinase [Dysgonomonas alginatilytica]PXV62328.1 histidine kinase [Dysgonomonas alginatilytica]
MSESIKTTFLYSFLTDSKYRIFRHVLLIFFVLVVICFNQTYITYQPSLKALGSKLYLLAFITTVAYIVIVYFNLYVLVPKLLLKKKYVSYITALSALVLLLVIAINAQEYIAYTLLDIPHVRSSYLNYVTLLDGISNFTINMLCISGGSMVVLLKYWMENEQVVNQLRNEQMQSEVEQLKDQINPQFLFNILNRASTLTKTDPKLASDMLLKLSHLLRYQLYDCSRDKVLLSSEITFLTNYLDLEKLYFDKFDYSISSQGDVHRVFVSPMLFTPFVQSTINRIQTLDIESFMHLHFKADDDTVYFTYDLSNNKMLIDDSEFSGIKQRLNLLYNSNYDLTTSKGMIGLKLRS